MTHLRAEFHISFRIWFDDDSHIQCFSKRDVQPLNSQNIATWVSGLLSLNPSSGNTSLSERPLLFPRPAPSPSPVFICLFPALPFCLTTATASAGMSAAWRDTHIKMNSPIRHCFRCYTTTELFVIRSSPSLPQTPSCVQRLFPCKCSTIAHFLLHTHTVMALNNARLYLRASVLY